MASDISGIGVWWNSSSINLSAKWGYQIYRDHLGEVLL